MQQSILMRLAILILILVGTSHVIYAQETKSDSSAESSTPWFKLSGAITITGDYYSMNSSTDSNDFPIWAPRRPSNLYRLILTPTITLFHTVTLPFNIVLSSRETNTITPATLSPTLWQFLQNPLNSFGVTFSPGVEWATISAGSHTPRYSELCGSELQFFGGGILLTPNILRLGFNMGIAQRSVAPDSANNIYGAYRRITTMAKLGFGKENTGYIDLNFVRTADDTTAFAGKPKPFTTGIIRTEIAKDSNGFPIYTESVGNVPLLAQEGVLFSLASRLPLTDNVTLATEAAFSGYTRDITANKVDKLPGVFPTFIIQPRESSHGDFAGIAALNFTFQDWGFETKGKYVGAGFVSLGSLFAQSDYLDLTLSPHFMLLEGDILFSGTIGTRTNQFSLSTEEQTTQLLGAVNLNIIPVQNLSIAFAFSNFGYRNNVSNDTLRVQSVSRSFSVTPSLTIFGSGATHTITFSAGLDSYRDFNVVSGRLSDNNTFTLFGIYSIALTPTPLSTSLSGTYLKNDLPTFGFTSIGSSLDVSYRLFKDKLIPSAGISFNLNTLTGFSADKQFLLRGGLRSMLTEKLTLSANAAVNMYRYGSAKPNGHFQENTLQLAITMMF